MSSDDDKVGYGRPPKKNRFQKGRSGNPKGRPKKVKPQNDLKSMLERVGNEEIEIGGEVTTMRELEFRSLQRKAVKGDVAASRHLAKLRSDAGCGQTEAKTGGVLVVPGTRPLEEWSIAALKQQAQFREKPEGDE